MRLDLDTYKEILDTITRNKSRSLLTGFGVFWGVFMLIALSGGGQGLREMLQNNFAGFATNASVIWAPPRHTGASTRAGNGAWTPRTS
jgi:putative ABC transport system permease protein